MSPPLWRTLIRTLLERKKERAPNLSNKWRWSRKRVWQLPMWSRFDGSVWREMVPREEGISSSIFAFWFLFHPVDGGLGSTVCLKKEQVWETMKSGTFLSKNVVFFGAVLCEFEEWYGCRFVVSEAVEWLGSTICCRRGKHVRPWVVDDLEQTQDTFNFPAWMNDMQVARVSARYSLTFG